MPAASAAEALDAWGPQGGPGSSHRSSSSGASMQSDGPPLQAAGARLKPTGWRQTKDWLQDSRQMQTLLVGQVAPPTDLRHGMSCLCCEKPRRPLRRPPPDGPAHGSSSHQFQELFLQQTAPPSDLHADVVPCLYCEEPAKTRGPGRQRFWHGGAVAELLREQVAPPLDLLNAGLPNLSCCDEQPHWAYPEPPCAASELDMLRRQASSQPGRRPPGGRQWQTARSKTPVGSRTPSGRSARRQQSQPQLRRRSSSCTRIATPCETGFGGPVRWTNCSA